MSKRYTGVVIVIPTRNRADITMNAIKSALTQEGCGDLRILVSDNSTSESQAMRLAEYCRQVGDERLRYVRPPEPLAMSPHWDWASIQALELYTASHITFLTDRMIFKPAALGKLARVSSQYPNKVISYMHDRVDDDVRPIRVQLNSWTGKLFSIESARLLQATAESSLLEALPRMLNCLTPRNKLELLRSHFGNCFGSIAPDFSFCFRLLATEDSILYQDESLLVHYALNRSNGASASRGEMTADRADFITASGALKYFATPIPEILTVHNAIIHEYCIARTQTGSRKFPALDIQRYLHTIAGELVHIANTEVRRETERLLARHGWVDTQAAARAESVWRKVLSPKRVWGRLARDARKLSQRFLPPAAVPRGFLTVKEALDHAAGHSGSKLPADHWQTSGGLGFVEIPAVAKLVATPRASEYPTVAGQEPRRG